jgi:hypothetical protein
LFKFQSRFISVSALDFNAENMSFRRCKNSLL